MIIVISWADPGQPKQDVEQIQDATRINTTVAGVLEVRNDYDVVLKVYAPGKWIEAKKL